MKLGRKKIVLTALLLVQLQRIYLFSTSNAEIQIWRYENITIPYDDQFLTRLTKINFEPCYKIEFYKFKTHHTEFIKS